MWLFFCSLTSPTRAQLGARFQGRMSNDLRMLQKTKSKPVVRGPMRGLLGREN